MPQKPPIRLDVPQSVEQWLNTAKAKLGPGTKRGWSNQQLLHEFKKMLEVAGVDTKALQMDSRFLATLRENIVSGDPGELAGQIKGLPQVPKKELTGIRSVTGISATDARAATGRKTLILAAGADRAPRIQKVLGLMDAAKSGKNFDSVLDGLLNETGLGKFKELSSGTYDGRQNRKAISDLLKSLNLGGSPKRQAEAVSLLLQTQVKATVGEEAFKTAVGKSPLLKAISAKTLEKTIPHITEGNAAATTALEAAGKPTGLGRLAKGLRGTAGALGGVAVGLAAAPILEGTVQNIFQGVNRRQNTLDEAARSVPSVSDILAQMDQETLLQQRALRLAQQSPEIYAALARGQDAVPASMPQESVPGTLSYQMGTPQQAPQKRTLTPEEVGLLLQGV